MAPGNPADIRAQAGPHVFVTDLESLELADDDRHHLEKSLRLRPGDPLTVSDGNGSWRTASFGSNVEPTGPINVVDSPAYEIGLGIALTKASKPEFAVQKATELGLDTIIVFPGAHSVARWDETKIAKNELRLAKVAREASMQSRRVTIPQVQVVAGLASIVESRNVARADFVGIPTNVDHQFLVVGPEGGWSDEERSLVPEVVDLGKTVLRSETAAVVGAAFLARSRDQTV